MTHDLRDRLASIVEQRHSELPEVEARLSRITSIESELRHLLDAGADLPQEWAESPDIADALERLRDSQLFSELAAARASLEAVRARFSRETINLGVSGRARVGKSAMLQTISGLGPEQVPTGEASNVTAVRSRIFHANREQAFVQFHTEASFLESVVRPYFRDLNLGTPPSTIEQFLRSDLRDDPDAPDLSKKGEDQLRRLRDIQRSVGSLRLDGGELALTDLSDLRRYIAYETTASIEREEAGGTAAPRDYLGVRDCRIEAPFPVTAVDRLGLVDLPGLGEVAPDVSERIAAGLRGDVDVVLMVFRPVIGLTNVDEIDLAALQIISEAQGGIEDSRDFTWVVINVGPDDGERAADLHSQIRRRLNGGADDSHYTVAIADALSAESIHEEVLSPVLERLSSRLPVMDGQVLARAASDAATPLQTIANATAILATAIQRFRAETPDTWQELHELAHNLRMDVQQDLKAIQPHGLISHFVALYEEQLDATHDEVRAWLTNGLGAFASTEAWVSQADGEWGLVQSHRPYLLAELHRLRVAITKRYANLDAFLNNFLVEEFYVQIADAFCGVHADPSSTRSGSDRRALGGQTQTGTARIAAIVERLRLCEPPIPGLSAAVESLVGIRFDFRLQSYPLLYDLNLDRRPVDSDTQEESYPPAFPKESTGLMYAWLEEEFTQYSYQVKSELREDAIRQFKVLAGAAVVLEDEVVRSGTSAAEFRSLAAGYRDELWPGRFDTANTSSARVRRLQERALKLDAVVRAAMEES